MFITFGLIALLAIVMVSRGIPMFSNATGQSSNLANPLNKGATPPGCSRRSYNGATLNADQEIILQTDDGGMIAECSIKNTHASAGLSYTCVTKDLNGQTTTTGPTNLAAAGIINLAHGTGGVAATPKFITSMSIKVKSTVADTPATFTAEFAALHTGTAPVLA